VWKYGKRLFGLIATRPPKPPLPLLSPARVRAKAHAGAVWWKANKESRNLSTLFQQFADVQSEVGDSPVQVFVPDPKPL